jgi:hypothetical protein
MRRALRSIELFVVPTAFFKLLYGLVILRHERRRLIGFGVTAHPTAEWIAHQVTEAFPWDEAPRYLIRDRDGAFGQHIHAGFARWESVTVRPLLTYPGETGMLSV